MRLGYFAGACAALGAWAWLATPSMAATGPLNYSSDNLSLDVSATAQTSTVITESDSNTFTGLELNQTITKTAIAPSSEDIPFASSGISAIHQSSLTPSQIAINGTLDAVLTFQQGATSASGSADATFITAFSVARPTPFRMFAVLAAQPIDALSVSTQSADYFLMGGTTVISTGSLPSLITGPAGFSASGLLQPGVDYSLEVGAHINEANELGQPLSYSLTLDATPLPSAVVMGLACMALILARRLLDKWIRRAAD